MSHISISPVCRSSIAATLLSALAACGGGDTSVTPVTPVTPSATGGSATLTWIAPQTNADGSALTNLLGFHVYYGTDANVLGSLRDVPGAAASDTAFTKLAPGTYYFAVTAYTADGAESELSVVVSKDVT